MEKNKNDIPILDINDIVGNLNNKSFGSLGDIQKIISQFINRGDIDLISRIKDTELDNICNMLFQSHTLSIKWTLRRLQLKNKNKKIHEIIISKEDVIISAGEEYALKHLNLTLSLDSQSRTEIKEILISLIKKEIETQYREKEIENKRN